MSLHRDQTRNRAGDRGIEVRAEAGFKPVALPALAAAVEAVKPRRRHQPPRELPPILRQDSAVD
jgi:hypothetical protein